MIQDPISFYLQAQQVILNRVTSANQATVVPACPKWTLRHLIAHQVGALEDIASGNLDGVPGDRWTAAHIARFADLDLDQVKSRWIEIVNDPQSAELVKNMVTDVVIHEFDTRGAFGDNAARDEDRVDFALQGVLDQRNGYFQENHIPTLEVVTAGTTTILGEGASQGKVTLSPWEATRVFTGRRSPDQTRRLDWSTDPTQWLEHLSGLGVRETDLVE